MALLQKHSLGNFICKIFFLYLFVAYKRKSLASKRPTIQIQRFSSQRKWKSSCEVIDKHQVNSFPVAQLVEHGASKRQDHGFDSQGKQVTVT